MSKFALLLVAVIACCYGAMGKSQNAFISAERTDNTGSLYPERASAGVWGHSKVPREVADQNYSEQPDLCFFLKDSEIEGHISCRLRYSRSKFNRNPFGLRFGKREWSYLPKSKTARPGTSKLLPYLLYFQERRV
ncbi:kisspeptin 2 [Conger conger]|uniref:kisspeptin 2 n=1 Tax=Conger conger TaxID=82655 RepID=UPI002A59B78D|nr:kisspeptin 2 [Conger conger]